MNIYTIGFTKSSAEHFFSRLINNNIKIVLDVRINNTSQLAGFSKYPDIEYFLKSIADIKYMSDINFAPTDSILKDYKNKDISWEEYENKFTELMKERSIEEYIKNNYGIALKKNLCLLCSEDNANKCHRRFIAEYFRKVFGNNIIHL